LIAKCGKYSLAKFANFVYFCILRAEIATTIGSENGSNFRAQYKSTQNLRTLQGYIFRILQHFATKLCNFTNFSTLFPETYFFCQDKKLVYNGNCLLGRTQLIESKAFYKSWYLWQPPCDSCLYSGSTCSYRADPLIK
jgi:hypothetical protein